MASHNRDLNRKMTVSASQYRLICNALSFPAAALSSIGSVLILRNILRGTKKLTDLYRRLMFSISLLDLIMSVHFAIFSVTSQNFDVSRSTGAVCSYEGFIITISGLTSVLYNGFLSLYFLLRIRYGQRNALGKAEPMVHAFSLLYCVVVGILGATLGVYVPGNEYERSCWLNPDVSSDDTGMSSWQFQLVNWMTLIPGAIIFFVLLVNNILIYLKVRTIYNANDKYKIRAGERPSFQTNPSTKMMTANSSATLANNKASSRRLHTTTRGGGGGQGEQQHKHVKQVAQQSFLYVGGYFAIYIWTFAFRAGHVTDPEAWFGSEVRPVPAALVLRGFVAFFIPLAGLFNALVYFRPQYIRWRDLNKETGRSRLWCIGMAALSLEKPSKRAVVISTGDNQPAVAESRVAVPVEEHNADVEQPVERRAVPLPVDDEPSTGSEALATGSDEQNTDGESMERRTVASGDNEQSNDE